MNFGSLFTGVGGFDLALERAGMKCAWQCEIDKYCVEVLEEHWKGMRRYDDVRKITKDNTDTVDLICGGFPCQDLSVAGKRAGLDGERSGLWFEFERIIGELRPQWVIIENVPGLLSSRGGADFAVVLQALVQFGYGVSWRILDAQYFGVPQKRRRVFIVGSLGNERAIEILFEQEGLFRDFAESGRKRSGASREIKEGAYWNNGEVADTLDSSQLLKRQMMPEKRRFPVIFQPSQTLWQMNHASEVYRDCGTMSPTLQERMGTGGNNVPLAGLRRLTPLECERLQGFPDGWTSSQSDTQRYKQMGNAVAVPVAEWIGKRIVKISQGET